MGYIFVESEFNRLVESLRSDIGILDNFEDQEYCQTITHALDTLDKLEQSCDTTDAVKIEMTDDFKRMLEGYKWE